MNRSVEHYDTEDRLRKALLTAGFSASGACDGGGASDESVAGSDLSIYDDDDDNDEVGNNNNTSNSNNNTNDDATDKAKDRDLLLSKQPLDWVLVNYDRGTTEQQSVKQELHRLQVLKSYWILDSDHSEDFDRLTRLASQHFRTSVAMIGLMDLGREWLLSAVGYGDTREIQRQVSFGNHALLNKRNLLIVPDASKDPRFQSFPDVVKPHGWKFYAAVPLVAPEGYKIGTFSIADSEPRPEGLSEEDTIMLYDWAALAIRQIVKRKSNMVWNQHNQQPTCTQQMIAYTSHDLMTPLTGVQLSLSILRDCENIKSRCTPHQQLLLRQAADCSDFMVRIGQAAMCTLGNGNGEARTFLKQGQTKMTSLVENLVMVMEPNPKRVPLIITLDDSVPEYVACDDLVLLRSAINLISNGLRRTITGCVHLRISAEQNKRIRHISSNSCVQQVGTQQQQETTCGGDGGGGGASSSAVVDPTGGESCAASGAPTENTGNHPLYDLFFECTDTGPEIPTKDYAHLFHAPPPSPEGAAEGNSGNEGLGLLSVATLIHSLDGDFGFRPPRRPEFHGNCNQASPPCQVAQQKDEGSTFWFRVPAISGLPEPFFHDEDSESGAEEVPWHLLAPADSTTATTAARESGTEKQQQCSSSSDEVPTTAVVVPITTTAEAEEKAFLPSSEDVVGAAPATTTTSMPPLGLVLAAQLPADVSISTTSKQGTTAVYSSDADSKLPALNILGKRHCSSADTGSFSLPATIYSTAPGANPYKRPKVIESLAQQDPTAVTPVCLLATDTPTQYSNEALTRLEQCGWKVVVVHEGQDALRLLKMRHWNIVLFDDDICKTPSPSSDGKKDQNLCCYGVVQEFRSWEQRSRAGFLRQDNLYMVCTKQHAIPSALDPRSVVLPPTGFNGVLGKPVQWKELKQFLIGNEVVQQELVLPVPPAAS